jgi:hypothetical protein
MAKIGLSISSTIPAVTGQETSGKVPLRIFHGDMAFARYVLVEVAKGVRPHKRIRPCGAD